MASQIPSCEKNVKSAFVSSPESFMRSLHRTPRQRKIGKIAQHELEAEITDGLKKILQYAHSFQRNKSSKSVFSR